MLLVKLSGDRCSELLEGARNLGHRVEVTLLGIWALTTSPFLKELTESFWRDRNEGIPLFLCCAVRVTKQVVYCAVDRQVCSVRVWNIWPLFQD